MTRAEMKAAARRLAPLIAWLNAGRSTHEARKVPKRLDDFQAEMKAATRRLVQLMAALNTSDSGTRARLLTTRRTVARLHSWVEYCAGRGAETRLRFVRRLARRKRLPLSDQIAAEWLKRICALGVFRCQHTGCGKLALDTSGRSDRKYCDRNCKQAHIMALQFAKAQADKVRRVRVAIAQCSQCDNPKRWIAERAGVSLRWITEAERRGDIRLPSTKGRRARIRVPEAPTQPGRLTLAVVKDAIRGIKRLGIAPNDESPAQRLLHNARDSQGRLCRVETVDDPDPRLLKAFGSGSLKIYRYPCWRCGQEVGTHLVCPSCGERDPRREARPRKA